MSTFSSKNKSGIFNRIENSSMHKSKIIIASSLLLVLSACGDSNDEAPITPEPAEYSYAITVTNLTYAQPLSPVAVILHDDSKMWMTGQPATDSLEQLAESGDNSGFISDPNALASISGEGVVLPGAQSTVEITTTDKNANYFTFASMLVNTNDAFTGLTGVDISNMAIDDAKSWNLNVYDSGTEANSEAAGTIPGPADGGTGFDASRNDVDFVALHSGVVSQDDGLSSSVLTQSHRFDNPAIKLTITRTK